MSCELKKEELDQKLKEILEFLLSADGITPKDDDQLIEFINNSPYKTLLNRPLHEFYDPESDTDTDDYSDIIEIEVR